jgi:hypothetical protein
MSISSYTPEEITAYNSAQALMKRCMQDDVPLDVFNQAAANFNAIATANAQARYLRTVQMNKNIIRRIFKK